MAENVSKCGTCDGCLKENLNCDICDNCLIQQNRHQCVEKICYNHRVEKANIPALVLGIIECDKFVEEENLEIDEVSYVSEVESFSKEEIDPLEWDPELRELVPEKVPDISDICEDFFESMSAESEPYLLLGLEGEGDIVLFDCVNKIRDIFEDKNGPRH